MKNSRLILCLGILTPLSFFSSLGCKNAQPSQPAASARDTSFVWMADQFADLGVARYQIPGWDKLSLQQKELVYYLTQAGLSGRDIIWDQNYRYNLAIRKALESIIENYKGDTTIGDWNKFIIYAKRVFFSNGIHHHYSMEKIVPDFSEAYFSKLLYDSHTALDDGIEDIMFNPDVDAKKVSLDPGVDLLQASATNFYGPDVTQAEAEAYYAKKIDKKDPHPVEYGLNSTLVKTPGDGLTEEVWKADGKYGDAIKQIIYWLDKAVGVAENQKQADALKLLIEYYKTGDLNIWSQYNIAWAAATEGDIDYINGFIEVYNDPLGYHGSYESIVEINDFDASKRMQVLSDHAQYFEDNSPIMPEHKKKNVVGISYKVVNVAGESGDASPSTPIGVNLPNSNWIRTDYGSKSVSLGNIVTAYDKAGGSGLTNEFCYSQEEKDRALKYGQLGADMLTAMHEVIGHASGQINPGVGTPKETLKNYANTLEEARADLVALYYIMDPKLVDWGLIPSLEVGKAEYDSYIRNGLMVQLRRIEPGGNIEEAHMRNRQMIASWCYEHGKTENVIEKKTLDGKTYFVINDYNKLRDLFGQLLREVQRIKSEGDYKAGKNLVETYGVKVDSAIHQEVLDRSAKLNIPPYFGFINPELVPVTDSGGNITDIKVVYPDNFLDQMLDYGKKYSFLKPGM